MTTIASKEDGSMLFPALAISFKSRRLSDLSARLITGCFEADYGEVLRRLVTLRAELTAIERLRERGIDAVNRDRSALS
jgi:hypothetical protein